MLISDVGVNAPIIYFNIDDYKVTDTIKPFEVSRSHLKSFHGVILNYNPATILINHSYGGLDVQDDGYYIKPEINLYELFIATFKRTPFDNENINFVVAKDVAIIAADVVNPSIDVGRGWPTSVRLGMLNKGLISGRGGGAGISAYRIEEWEYSADHERWWYINQHYGQSNVATAGRDGGLAIIGDSVGIAITNEGAITGGGGGGGGTGWWNYTAYSGGSDPLNECSGVLSNSGGAPYGQPFDSVYGWQRWLLFTRSTGRLGTAVQNYLAAPVQGEFHVGKNASGEYFFRYWNDDPFSGIHGPWDAEDIRIDFIIRQLGDAYPYLVFRPNTIGHPVLGSDSVLSIGSDKLAILAKRSGLSTAASGGGDVGWIGDNPINPNLNPYSVMERIKMGYFEVGTPNFIEQDKIMKMRLGSKGGDIGYDGEDGTLPAQDICFDIYQPSADKVRNLGYRGIVNRAPPGRLNYSSPGALGGKAGGVSMGNVTITNTGSGFTRGN